MVINTRSYCWGSCNVKARRTRQGSGPASPPPGGPARPSQAGVSGGRCACEEGLSIVAASSPDSHLPLVSGRAIRPVMVVLVVAAAIVCGLAPSAIWLRTSFAELRSHYDASYPLVLEWNATRVRGRLEAARLEIAVPDGSQAPGGDGLRLMTYNVKFGGGRIDFFFDCHGQRWCDYSRNFPSQLECVGWLEHRAAPDPRSGRR